MAITEQQFLIELYAEHLEEASFLWEQRNAAQQDSALTWMSVANYEGRLDAHLDALVIGRELAFGVCQEREIEADAGELYAIVSVYCRANNLQALFTSLEQLDYEDAEKVAALLGALIDHAPLQWQETLSKVKLESKTMAIPIIVPFLCYSKQSLSEQHVGLVAEMLSNNTQILHYLKSMDMMGLYDSVTPLLFDEDKSTRELALVFLLFQGQPQIVNYTLNHLNRDLLPLPALTLAADPSMLALLSNTQFESNVEGAIKAMSYMGTRECIPILLRFLGGDHSAVAAQALFVVTGAPLFEEIFEAEEMTEDDVFPEELAAFREGKLPTRVDGKAFGCNVSALTEDREHWMLWLKQHEVNFQAQKRYRFGGPITPLSLCQILESSYSDYEVRQHTYQELVVRYQCTLPFSVNDWVHKQYRDLAEIKRWAQSVNDHYAPGDWFLFGEVV
ncbi:hypothetical protein A9Q99_22040 [Gammaproteobacteria bacterium 45_16_T64]|nr:hypothetical protein A9Q99_22040 [Gammaproteobacteria bacterium 45_16_T64]